MALGIRGKGATFQIIQKRVGKNGENRVDEVRRLNQLLRMAGYLKTGEGSDTSWSTQSNTALMDFYKACPETPIALEYIDPQDHQNSLLALAKAAGVIITYPGNLRSSSAVTKFYETCRNEDYPYGWKEYGQGTKMIMGFYGHSNYGICVTKTYDFSPFDRISFNCTSFANVLMSVWMMGNTSKAPYFHGQSAGGYNPLGLRYNMNRVNAEGIVNGYCYEVDAIEAVVRDNELYNFCSCQSDGFITHDMVLMNGYVYECNTHTPRAIFRTKLREKFATMRSKGRHVQLVGPMAV